MHWFERQEQAEMNDAEVLFLAFLLVAAPGSAGNLQAWAKQVSACSTGAAEQREKWKPPAASEGGWPVKDGSSTIFEPLRAAFLNTKWPDETLDQIGVAMQLWDGPAPGAREKLRHKQLRDYVATQPPGLRRSKKDSVKSCPPRWRTFQVCRVAELVHRSGPALQVAVQVRRTAPATEILLSRKMT